MEFKDFTNTKGLSTLLTGTKKGTKPHAAIYLTRTHAPEGAVDWKPDTKKASGGVFDQKARVKQARNDEAGSTKPEKIESVSYEPVQMQLHAPSEHTIDSRAYDLELQMVMEPVDAYKTQAEKVGKA